MKKILPLIALTSMLGTPQRFAQAENRVGDKKFTLPISPRPFTDVPLGHWSYPVLCKMLSLFEPKFVFRPIQHPISIYDFASMTMRYEARADARSIAPEARDLFVALKYEYGMEIIALLTSGRSGMDGYYSEADKKRFTEFALAAQKKHDTLSPDQWSDFLDDAQRSPLFAGN